MILPPPNITGTLHLGHALTATIQDVMIKWRRMRGIDTTWIPGMDHAGIATQVIVEKRIWSESRRTRHDVGRDEFDREVWKWKGDKSNVIGQQLRRLGVSLDWTRDYFTMDPDHTQTVIEAFVRLHESGLIYESDALVNWCCTLQSAVSDIEVEHLEITKRTLIPIPQRAKSVEFGVMTNFLYKLQDYDNNNTEQKIKVATTRPETILGDVALAVHPEDSRYNHLIGRRVVHPFRKSTTLPIVGDASVDRNFGTGVVKLTPGHDRDDFETAKRHNLQVLTVFDERGSVVVNCGDPRFDGLDRFDARDRVLDALQNLGLLVSRQDHVMSVPLCSRSKDVIEFLIKPQWFVNCRDMAEGALRSVRQGLIRIDPEAHEKVWSNYLENIRDWCISRQLWWGHRIPAYRCSRHSKHITVVARDETEARTKAARILGEGTDDHDVNDDDAELRVRQVDDVLDTWFSSALIPLSVAKWPSSEQEEEESFSQSKQYPLSVMETGHDILFFWVARTVMLCTYLTGREPFPDVLLHGILCDATGRKMSKSLGNVIAPEDVIEGRTLRQLEESSRRAHDNGLLSRDELTKAIKGQRKMFPDGIAECGTDALRFTLCSHNIKNRFINFDVQECKVNKFFGNKIWQSTKFVIKWCEHLDQLETKRFDDLSDMDRWILSRKSFAMMNVNEALTNNNLYKATNALKNFLHYEFCDVYLEYTKRGLKESNGTHCKVLVHCLEESLRALAPFMPHLSQHLHSHLDASLRHSPFALLSTRDEHYYPVARTETDRHVDIEIRVEKMMAIVTGIRRLRKIFNVSGKQGPQAIVSEANHDQWLRSFASVIGDLSGCASVDFRSAVPPPDYVSDKIDSVGIHLRVPEESRRSFEVDARKLDARRAKLAKELESLASVSDEAKRNTDRISLLNEKISRIDLIKSFAS